MICLGCQDQEHDCCLNILTPGRCECGCPQLTGPLIIAMPDPYRPARQCLHELPPANGRIRSHCRRGHRLQGSNIYIEPSTGNRACLTCRRTSWARKQERRRKDWKETA